MIKKSLCFVKQFAVSSDKSEVYPGGDEKNESAEYASLNISKKMGLTLSCYPLDFNGEPCKIRTCDPLIKSQLLYQLS
jgi:hypothetical protein